MKIRLDFVSNSSSASFLIHLPNQIEDYSADEFLKLFKTNDKKYDYDDPLVENNSVYFEVDLLEELNCHTPFNLDDGSFLYHITVNDNSDVDLYNAMIMEAKENKDLITSWKYDS